MKHFTKPTKALIEEFKELWINTGLTEKQIRLKLHLTYGQISDLIKGLNLPERTEREKLDHIIDRIKDEYKVDTRNKNHWLEKYQLSGLSLELLWDKLVDMEKSKVFDSVYMEALKLFKEGHTIQEIGTKLDFSPVYILKCLRTKYPKIDANVRYRAGVVLREIRKLKNKTDVDLRRERDRQVKKLEKNLEVVLQEVGSL